MSITAAGVIKGRISISLIFRYSDRRGIRSFILFCTSEERHPCGVSPPANYSITQKKKFIQQKCFFVIRLERDGNFLSFFQKQAVPPQLAANCD